LHSHFIDPIAPLAAPASRHHGQTVMLLLVFIPLVLCAGLCLIPVCLLRRRAYARAQDYFVASQPTPPAVIRNSSIAHALRIAAFGPFFAWGASGDLWPAIVGAAAFGLGLLLLYVLRGPVLKFLDDALDRDRSITVHAFIARQHGNDPRVALLASSLTLFALFGLVVGESVAVAALLKPLLTESTALVYVSVLAMLMIAAAGATLSGHSGAMHSTQLQLGLAYLGLFGSTALLLYLHVSALTPMPPHGTFAAAFVAAWCAVILWYRRSKYVDTNVIRVIGASAGETGRVPPGAKLLKKFEQILSPCISVFAVLVVVVAGMEFYFAGVLSIGRDSIAALQAGTRLSGPGLIALALLPLLYPMVDVAGWQRIAAIEKAGDAGRAGPGGGATLREIFRMYAAEGPLLWLFMGLFGAIAAIATETPLDADVMPAFMAQLVEDQNEVTVVVLPLFLVALFAIALSAMVSIFSASLATIRFDILPRILPQAASSRAAPDEPIAIRRTIVAGAGFFLAIVIAFFVADGLLRVGFATSAFLALLFAICCAQLSFAPLVLGPIVAASRATVGPLSAVAVMCCSAASGAAAVAIYVASANEAWLWAAVPACLGMGLLVFAVARMMSGPPASL
jgi:hypothetical protein